MTRAKETNKSGQVWGTTTKPQRGFVEKFAKKREPAGGTAQKERTAMTREIVIARPPTKAYMKKKNDHKETEGDNQDGVGIPPATMASPAKPGRPNKRHVKERAPTGRAEKTRELNVWRSSYRAAK